MEQDLSQTRQLFVGNIPFRMRWQEVKDLFRQAGHVLRADVALSPDNKSKGHGTVLFATVHDAQNAIDLLHGYKWHGRILQVRKDRDFVESVQTRQSSRNALQSSLEITPSSVNGGRQLFVANLPFHCQWQDVKDLFRNAGNIIRADVAQGLDGRSRGFGTVLYATVEDALKAITLFDGYVFHGRILRVHFDKHTLTARHLLHPLNALTAMHNTSMLNQGNIHPAFAPHRGQPYVTTLPLGHLPTATPRAPFLPNESNPISGNFPDFSRLPNDSFARDPLGARMLPAIQTKSYVGERSGSFAFGYPWSPPDTTAVSPPFPNTASTSTRHYVSTAAGPCSVGPFPPQLPSLKRDSSPYLHDTMLIEAMSTLSLTEGSTGQAGETRSTADNHNVYTPLSPPTSSITADILGLSTLGGAGVWDSFKGFKFS